MGGGEIIKVKIFGGDALSLSFKATGMYVHKSDKVSKRPQSSEGKH